MDQNEYLTPEQLTHALHGSWRGREGRATCPVHGGDDNFTIHHGTDGRPRVYCRTNQCDFKDIVAALRDRGLWPGKNAADWTPPTPAQRAQAKRDQAEQEQERIKVALKQWSETKPLRGTLSDRYLRKVRGRDADGIPDLRHHEGIYYTRTEKAPALVAAIRSIHTGEIQGVHRTFLNADGTKHKHKRTMKGRAKDGAIMLDPFDAVIGGLVICEGLEDGLAIRSIQRPVWSLMDAGNIEHFPVLAGIEVLTIYSDKDDNGTGQNASRACGQRWANAGVEVLIRTPIKGKDADEVLP